MLQSRWSSIFIHRIYYAICEELVFHSKINIKLCYYEMLLNLIQFLYCWNLFSMFAFVLLPPLINYEMKVKFQKCDALNFIISNQFWYPLLHELH